MFTIGKADPRSRCHQDQIIEVTNKGKEEIENVILYLVRSGYAIHSGQYGEPLYNLTKAGQIASLDRQFLRTGRNETYKTLSVYGAYIAIVTSIATLIISLATNHQVTELERRSKLMEGALDQYGRQPLPNNTFGGQAHQEDYNSSLISDTVHTPVQGAENTAAASLPGPAIN